MGVRGDTVKLCKLIHDDNPKQGFFLRGEGGDEGTGQGY